MSAWMSVAVSYLPEILSLAKPLFTRSKSSAPAPDVVTQQIAELQAAATQNAESINRLAVDMQKTIDVVQAAAVQLERRLARTQLLLAVALTASGLAFVLAGVVLLQR